jgi:hypothetical protein
MRVDMPFASTKNNGPIASTKNNGPTIESPFTLADTLGISYLVCVM